MADVDLVADLNDQDDDGLGWSIPRPPDPSREATIRGPLAAVEGSAVWGSARPADVDAALAEVDEPVTTGQSR